MTLFQIPEASRPGFPCYVLPYEGLPKSAVGAAVPPVEKLRAMPQFSWLSAMSDDEQILRHARSWAWVEMDGEVQPVPNMKTTTRLPQPVLLEMLDRNLQRVQQVLSSGGYSTGAMDCSAR